MKTIHHGILLKRINYSESSLILSFFTKEHGAQSYLFQGGKKKKGNLLQPLTIVEISVFKRPDSELGKVAEISPLYVFNSIPFHPVKSGVAFFIAEVLSSCLKSHDEDPNIYQFIINEIQFIDQNDVKANYVSWFLITLSKYLGFQPICDEESPKILDITEGVFRTTTPLGNDYILHEGIAQLAQMTRIPKDEALQIAANKSERKNNLETLLAYFKYHVDGFQTPKSLSILQTVFD